MEPEYVPTVWGGGRYGECLEPPLPEGQTIFSSNTSSAGKKRSASHACDSCRKRKSKCDGNKPACFACVNVYHTPCTYGEVPYVNKSAKKAAQQSPTETAKVLSSAVENLASIIESLLTSKSCDNAIITQLIDSQRRLKDTIKASNPESLITSPSLSRTGSAASNATVKRRQSRRQGDSLTSMNLDSPWFKSTPREPRFEDPPTTEAVDKLLSCYFQYHHPGTGIFAKEEFTRYFEAGLDRFCDRALLYSVLSVGCCYVPRPEEPFAPEYTESNRSLGERLAEAADKLVNKAKNVSLTLVQARAVLSSRLAILGLQEQCYTSQLEALKGSLETKFNPASAGHPLDKTKGQLATLTFRAICNLEIFSGLFFAKPSRLESYGIIMPDFPSDERRDSHVSSPPKDYGGAPEDRANLPFNQLCQVLRECDLGFYRSDATISLSKLKYAANCLMAFSEVLVGKDQAQVDPESTPIEELMVMMFVHQAGLMLFRHFRDFDLTSLGFDASQVCAFRVQSVIGFWKRIKAQNAVKKIRAEDVSAMVLWPLRDAMHGLLFMLADPNAVDELESLAGDMYKFSSRFPAACTITAVIRAQASQLSIPLPDGVKRLLLMTGPSPTPVCDAQDMFTLRAQLGPDLRALCRGPIPGPTPPQLRMDAQTMTLLESLGPRTMMGDPQLNMMAQSQAAMASAGGVAAPPQSGMPYLMGPQPLSLLDMPLDPALHMGNTNQTLAQIEPIPTYPEWVEALFEGQANRWE